MYNKYLQMKLNLGQTLKKLEIMVIFKLLKIFKKKFRFQIIAKMKFNLIKILMILLITY